MFHFRSICCRQKKDWSLPNWRKIPRQRASHRVSCYRRSDVASRNGLFVDFDAYFTRTTQQARLIVKCLTSGPVFAQYLRRAKLGQESNALTCSANIGEVSSVDERHCLLPGAAFMAASAHQRSVPAPTRPDNAYWAVIVRHKALAG